MSTDDDNVNALVIAAEASELLKRAEAQGFVLEISQVSVPPLAMGNLTPIIKVRKSRAAYTSVCAQSASTR